MTTFGDLFHNNTPKPPWPERADMIQVRRLLMPVFFKSGNPHCINIYGVPIGKHAHCVKGPFRSIAVNYKAL